MVKLELSLIIVGLIEESMTELVLEKILSSLNNMRSEIVIS